jgi:hypothetical protein
MQTVIIKTMQRRRVCNKANCQVFPLTPAVQAIKTLLRVESIKLKTAHDLLAKSVWR